MLKYISPNRGLEGVKLIDPILPITTPYYTAHIPVWHDTIKSSALELSEWEKEWRDEEAAGEVVRAVGAWVVVVQKPVLGNGEGDLVGHLFLPFFSLSFSVLLDDEGTILSPKKRRVWSLKEPSSLGRRMGKRNQRYQQVLIPAILYTRNTLNIPPSPPSHLSHLLPFSQVFITVPLTTEQTDPNPPNPNHHLSPPHAP